MFASIWSATSPQGSDLGPRLYAMFAKLIGEICRMHHIITMLTILRHTLFIDIQIHGVLYHRGFRNMLDRYQMLEERQPAKIKRRKTEFMVFTANMQTTNGDVSI
jgi:hypothetical protein